MSHAFLVKVTHSGYFLANARLIYRLIQARHTDRDNRMYTALPFSCDGSIGETDRRRRAGPRSADGRRLLRCRTRPRRHCWWRGSSCPSRSRSSAGPRPRWPGGRTARYTAPASSAAASCSSCVYRSSCQNPGPFLHFMRTRNYVYDFSNVVYTRDVPKHSEIARHTVLFFFFFCAR